MTMIDPALAPAVGARVTRDARLRASDVAEGGSGKIGGALASRWVRPLTNDAYGTP